MDEEKFNEAIEKVKEGAKDSEQSPTCITHEDCKVILEGFTGLIHQRDNLQGMLAAMDEKPEPDGAAHLAVCLSKALDVIEKMSRHGNRR